MCKLTGTLSTGPPQQYIYKCCNTIRNVCMYTTGSSHVHLKFPPPSDCSQDKMQLSHVIQALSPHRPGSSISSDMEPEYFQYLLLMLLSIARHRPHNLTVVAAELSNLLLREEEEGESQDDEGGGGEGGGEGGGGGGGGGGGAGGGGGGGGGAGGGGGGGGGDPGAGVNGGAAGVSDKKCCLKELVMGVGVCVGVHVCMRVVL